MTGEDSQRTGPAEGAPQPVPVPTGPIALVGAAIWAVALAVVLLVPSLHAGERHWWPWTCGTGIVLGLLAWVAVRRGRGNFSDA